MKNSRKKSVFICQGTACIASGSREIRETIEEEIEKLKLDDVEVKITGCHGFCQRGPIVVIEPEGIFYPEVKVEDAPEIVSSHLERNIPVDRLFYKNPLTGEPVSHYRDIPFYSRQKRIILRNCGHINPEDINDFLAIDGYKALKKVLSELSPKQVIEEIKSSGLRGRGGAGFPTGKKWEFCRNAPGTEKYMICNADEGDPGAFMDRSILEADPLSLIEGLTIAGYAIGAAEGYIYVRAEYPLAVKRIRLAIQQAEDSGYLGENILGSGFSFKINVKEGAGAFVCGEETALIASIEGKSGRPRPRPPYPAQSGLWGKPTIINNVKTLVSVPVILSRGAAWYTMTGTEKCKGTAVFALTGHIANCGLVEVPMGTTLREIIYDIGGGIPDGKKFKAVQTGGPSGGCLPASLLSYLVDYESLAAAGSIMGSGGMVVMNEDTCMVDVAHYFLDFAQKESCGECVPCRLGTKQMLDILKDIRSGRGKPEDIDLLFELAEAIKAGSLCGLGQTAPNPVLTTLRYFRDEYEAHVKYKRCPAVVCKEIISSPCQHVCPIETEAPVYISLIAEKRYDEAFDVILKDNPLPSVCARVCHRLCESKCQAGKWGSAIAIRDLKKFAVEHAIETGAYPVSKVRKPGGEKVAIIGSGPAGLTAGSHLALRGYDVTIFEAEDIPGGVLALYIPEYRLPMDRLNIDIESIRNNGVTIATGTRIEGDAALDELLTDFKAVFIATGADKPRRLHIENEEAEGVIDALELLKNTNLGKKTALGGRVGVIGGGNAAVDAARTAVRYRDCESVQIIYRRTRAEMPAFGDEIDAALEEGIGIQYLAAPVRIIAENGKMTGVECIRMELGEPDASGRRRPVPVEGSEYIIDLDTLIVAVGETPDTAYLENHGIELSQWNTVVVNPETYETSREGVFAGGDVVTGPGTVLDAMGAGKIAAGMIDMYIRGESLAREYKLTRPSMYIPPVSLTDEEIEEAIRPSMPCLPVHKRVHNFHEVELNLTGEMATREARRCLRCDLETGEGKKAMQQGETSDIIADAT